MNEFNKKYLQIAKSYNYVPNQIIQEGFLDDTGDFIKGKAKVLYNKLVTTVKSWFNSNVDQKTAKENAQKAKKLVGIETKDNVITQIVGGIIFGILPLLRKFDWFNKLCDMTKKYCKLFTSKEQKDNYIRYLKYNKKITYDQFKQTSYLDKQKQLYSYIKKSIQKQKVVSEEIIQQDLVAGLTALLWGIVALLVVLIIGFVVFNYCNNRWLGIGQAAAASVKRYEEIRRQEHERKKEEEQTKTLQKKQEQETKRQQLNLTQLTNLLKGCEALK